MEKKHEVHLIRKADAILITLRWIYLVWFGCGYVLLVANILPPWLHWANSMYLILGGTTLLVWLYTQMGKRYALLFFLICGGISWFAEWVGVSTGWFFGNYAYSNSFAPFLFGVPIAIPFAWCMVLILSRYLAGHSGNRILDDVLAATIAVAIDFLLDPVAVVQSYWQWKTDGFLTLYQVPWTNFLSWWLTAFLIFIVTRRVISVPVSNEKDLSFYPRVRTFFFTTQWLSHPVWCVFLTLELLFITIAFQHQLWIAILLHLLTLLVVFGIKYWVRRMKTSH